MEEIMGSNMKPKLSKQLDSEVFRDFYYLKEELVLFCKENGLQTSGGKLDLTERIVHYLDTGEKLYNEKDSKKKNNISEITLDTKIEKDFVCSEKHRAFFQDQIGRKFSFNVAFQKWLKNSSGKTYQDSIEAYYKIMGEKKTTKTTIDKQFEYNTYIRDFFSDNKGKDLKDAIQCWKYKKSLQGHNKYEKADLSAIK